MARSVFAGKFVRLAMVPILAAAVGIGTACVAQVHNDHKSPPAQQSSDFHFRDQDKQQLQSHYKSDVTRYQAHPEGRPQFSRGQRAPSNVHFQPVPSSYRRGMPAPPSGYQYGYSNGYVVAYNPTTRIIGDAIDLVDAATH
jgi:Ni/Co efflux regulator RcnB